MIASSSLVQRELGLQAWRTKGTFFFLSFFFLQQGVISCSRGFRCWLAEINFEIHSLDHRRGGGRFSTNCDLFTLTHSCQNNLEKQRLLAQVFQEGKMDVCCFCVWYLCVLGQAAMSQLSTVKDFPPECLVISHQILFDQEINVSAEVSPAQSEGSVWFSGQTSHLWAHYHGIIDTGAHIRLVCLHFMCLCLHKGGSS